MLKLRSLPLIILLDVRIICYQTRGKTKHTLIRAAVLKVWFPDHQYEHHWELVRKVNSFFFFLHFRPSESKAQGEIHALCFNKYSRWCWYTQKFNVHKKHLAIFLSSIFLFSRSGVNLRICISNKLSGDLITAGSEAKL